MDFFNFHDVSWGKDEAKGDRSLLEYFVSLPEFDNVISGDKRYVIGRKGTGKTAVIEKIRLDCDSDPLAFYSTLSLRDFPLSDLRDLRDKSFNDKSQFVPVWLFLIYVEMAKLAISDHGAASESVDDLKLFLRNNSLDSAVGFVGTISILKNNHAKISVDASWLGAEAGKSTTFGATINIHFNKIVNILREKLISINSESVYWLFMDELDEGYRSGDPGIRLILLSLFRAVEDSALSLEEAGFAYRPLLVLRSDIFDSLEGHLEKSSNLAMME